MPEKFPRGLSYQEYINTLDPERGMILELIWRSRHFEQMRCWDFSNPQIMEVRRYHRERGRPFGRLIEHYRFAPPVVARGVALAESKSIKHRSKSEKSHVRSGAAKQWEEEFTPLLRIVVRESAGPLLVQLGYEASTEW